MKTAAILALIFAASTVSAQTTIPTVQQLYQQQGAAIRQYYGTTMVLPTGPRTGTVIDPAGRMTPYIVAPSPGPTFTMSTSGRIGIQYEIAPGMVLNLD